MIRRAAVLAALLLGPACASFKMRDALAELQSSVEAYNEAFRWKNFERAAHFMPADLRASYLATYEDDENSLHVEDYQVVDLKMHDEKTATVTVRLRYMMLPSVTVEKASLVQHWKQIDGAWILETEENSIRELDLDEKPRNPAAFGRDVEEDPNAKTGVEVEDPKGNVIRKEGMDGEEGDDGE